VIVYRSQHRQADPAEVLDGLLRCAGELARSPSHDSVVDLLIGTGALEAAVADARHETEDDWDEIDRRFRRASVEAGDLLRLSWEGRPEDAAVRAGALVARLAAIPAAALPRSVPLQLPEGYVHYGVHPESYLIAAERCAGDRRPTRAVCIGLRSIGSSLSAVVAAVLESRGCAVASYTVRPRGHPFDRHLTLASRLEKALAGARDALFLIVDEGPGLSGSSLAGSASELSRLGIPDERIVLLPSWRTDGCGLRCAEARARWSRHRQFTASFEETWIANRRLLPEDAPPRDLSAGEWRAHFALAPPWPAVHPQHERRKLLTDSRLLSFSGLGGKARERLARARALADAGFFPAPIGTTNGFLVRPAVAGVPVAPGAQDPALLEAMARYLAHLSRNFPHGAASGGELREMVDVNVAEALGPQAERLLATHRRRQGDVCDEMPVALDGRMFPHEWLRTASGYVKVDALDHHDDHFFPGCRDIAWDVAGTCVEFELGSAEQRHFVERYRELSGDRSIAARLPAFRVAYLAFRTGYAHMATESLGDSPDGRRFSGLASRYVASLRAELGDG
jgi:hypothetical protein